MKQNFLFAVFFLISQLAFSQQEALDKFIDRHKEDAGVTYAFLSKDLFDVTIKADASQQQWQSLQRAIQDFGSLRILVGDSIDNSREMYQEVNGIVPGMELDELFNVKDGNDRVHLWVKDQDDTVNELVLLVGADHEFVLVCFSGVLKLQETMSLLGLFNSDEAQNLAHTSQTIAVPFQVFPNPATDSVTIQYDDASDPAESVSVIDQNGKVLTTFRLEGGNKQLNTQQIPNGAYWFQLKTKSGKVGVSQVQVIHKA